MYIYIDTIYSQTPEHRNTGCISGWLVKWHKNLKKRHQFTSCDERCTYDLDRLKHMAESTSIAHPAHTHTFERELD